LSKSTTGSSTSWSRGIPTQTKVYVDGFRIDTIDTPKLGDNVEEVVMTAKVRALLEEEDRKVVKIQAVPTNVNPRFIIITTEM